MAGMWHGVALIVLALVGSFAALFALVGAKFLPATGNAALDFLAQDKYYSVLLPMTLPTLFVAVYASWLGLKMFRSA